MNSRIKKLAAYILTTTCLLGLSSVANASMHSVTLGTSNGGPTYSGYTASPNNGAHTLCYRVTSFQFHGGMPSNSFPSGKNFTVLFSNIGVSKKYTTYDTTYKTKSYTADNTTIQAGVKSNYTKGVTVYLDWDENY